jgi:hypothetical protein
MIPYQFHQQSQVSGEMSYTFDPSSSFMLREVRLHASKPMSPDSTFVVQLDSQAGSAHDLKVVNENMSGETDFHQTFDPTTVFQNGDNFDVFAGVSGEDITYGCTIIWEKTS